MDWEEAQNKYGKAMWREQLYCTNNGRMMKCLSNIKLKLIQEPLSQNEVATLAYLENHLFLKANKEWDKLDEWWKNYYTDKIISEQFKREEVKLG